MHALQIRRQAALKEREGLVPPSLVDEAMAQEPDELAGELGGVPDHRLRGDAPTGGLGGAARGLLAFDFLFAEAPLLECGQQQREQVVGGPSRRGQAKPKGSCVNY
jgi:hypothetical protein